MAARSDVYDASNCITFIYFVQYDSIRSKYVHYLVVLYYHTTAKAIFTSTDSVPLLSVYHKVLRTERIECRAGSTSQLHEQAQDTMRLKPIQSISADNCSTVGLTRREYTKPWRTAAAACSCYAACTLLLLLSTCWFLLPQSGQVCATAPTSGATNVNSSLFCWSAAFMPSSTSKIFRARMSMSGVEAPQ
eukprot:9269-Heterococcus_DN1.PRE.1